MPLQTIQKYIKLHGSIATFFNKGRDRRQEMISLITPRIVSAAAEISIGLLVRHSVCGCELLRGKSGTALVCPSDASLPAAVEHWFAQIVHWP